MTELSRQELEKRALARGGTIEDDYWVVDGHRRSLTELADPPAPKPKEHRCPMCGDKHVGLMGYVEKGPLP